MSKFVNLHFNSEYSLLESSVTIDSYISFAIQNNISLLSITDHNNMYGVDKFIKLCRKNNIKPIVGVDLDVENFRLVLLAKNYQGFQELNRLVSLKSKQNINITDIKTKNLFVIDHPTFGYLSKNKKVLNGIDNFYYNSDNSKDAQAIIVKENRIIKNDENETISILNSIKNQEKKSFSFPGFTNESNVHESIVNRTNWVAEQCNIEFPEIKSLFPKFNTGSDITSLDYLKNLIKESFKEKFETMKNNDINIVKERIKYELSIIEKLNVSDYFLIIWDFMKWGKENSISFGPGRGSSAGSIISFLLGITEINPLEYNLLFERFLNPERISMPDIDIDVQDDKRSILIEYIQKKYGYEMVAQIITFQRMASKSAFRDVARVLEIPNSEVNIISKLIPLDIGLEEAYNKYSSFRAKINEKEIYTKAYNHALKIENLPRQRGTHAAGIIISEIPLVEKIPVIYENESLISQFSMDNLESWGMLKIDLLGLRTLSIIESIIEEINKKNDKKILFENIPLDDSKTNTLLSNGNTVGIFQLESPGMMNTLKKVEVNNFNDLVAIISLYRPGPMSNISTYSKIKHNEMKMNSLTKEYDEIVKSTYGIMIYQEQIMEIAQKFAGMPFGQADLLRRAIGKKDKLEMSKLESVFVNGALSKGKSKELIDKIYKEIEKFAEYGFNKSHAIAYATISYKMAYLKAWYPIEFYTSILSSLPGLDTINKYVVEARLMGYQIISPHINDSHENVYNLNSKIILPLIMIKGLGKVASDKIQNDKNINGEYSSFFNFVARARRMKLGDAIIDILIRSNSLRVFGNMSTLNANLTRAKYYADCVIISKDDELIIEYSLASEQELIIEEINMVDEMNYEEQYLGAKYNSFPTIDYETKDKLKNLSKQVEYKIILYVEKIVERKADKNGNQFGIVTLSDSSGSEEIFIFHPNWESFKKIKVSSLIECKIIKLQSQDKINFRISDWKVIK
ncbi:MAG: DNA polymerase III subunit alpha [Metamycoplasmataceae bacterium]